AGASPGRASLAVVAGRAAGLLAYRQPCPPGGVRDRLGELPAREGLRHRRGEDVPDQVVAAGRQRHRDLAVGTAVELAGPAGAGAAALGEPAVLDVEQPLVDEPVEVEA